MKKSYKISIKTVVGIIALTALGLLVTSNRSYIMPQLDQAEMHHFTSLMATGDRDTLKLWWQPGRTRAETSGFYSLVIVVDSTSTDFGNQDSLTIVSKERFYLVDVDRVRARSDVDSMVKYQVPDNDSTIHATRQAYTLQQPLYFTLKLGVADGAVIFLHNEATTGDSILVHTYVYSTK